MTKEKTHGLALPVFAISSDQVRTLHGIQVHYVTINDKYQHRRYTIERALFRAYTDALQRYLAKRPHISFTDKRNLARSLVYLPKGIKTWTAYMPGAFATHPVHNPEVKTLVHGQKIDFLTRRLFRHSVDAVGLRNRAHILAWAAHQQLAMPEQQVWLSLAGGSGQHVYDALELLGTTRPYKVVMTDIDREVLEFAQKLYELQKPPVESIEFKTIDALSSETLKSQLKLTPPSVVDIMGLVEYLEEKQISSLLKQLYGALVSGGMIVFTNMSKTHPQLDLHQRGLGWPGVKPRSVKEVVKIINEAGIILSQVTVFKSQDRVYGVYVIRKSIVS